jgi:hypothetical protein
MQLLIYPHEAEWTLFQTYCYSEKLVATGIGPGTSGPVAMNSGHWITDAARADRISHDFSQYRMSRKVHAERMSYDIIRYKGNMLTE